MIVKKKLHAMALGILAFIHHIFHILHEIVFLLNSHPHGGWVRVDWHSGLKSACARQPNTRKRYKNSQNITSICIKSRG